MNGAKQMRRRCCWNSQREVDQRFAAACANPSTG